MNAGRTLSSIESTKAKIIQGLNDEGFPVKEIADSNAHFNLRTTLGGRSYSIFQSKNKKDSVLVACTLRLTPEQIELYSKLKGEDKQSFFWNLRIALLTRQSVGDFKVKPGSPAHFEEVFISSKPVYYDGLTKDKFFSILYEIHKSAMMVTWMLEETTGAPSREEGLQIIYA